MNGNWEINKIYRSTQEEASISSLWQERKTRRREGQPLRRQPGEKKNKICTQKPYISHSILYIPSPPTLPWRRTLSSPRRPQTLSWPLPPAASCAGPPGTKKNKFASCTPQFPCLKTKHLVYRDVLLLIVLVLFVVLLLFEFSLHQNLDLLAVDHL